MWKGISDKLAGVLFGTTAEMVRVDEGSEDGAHVISARRLGRMVGYPSMTSRGRWTNPLPHKLPGGIEAQSI